MSPKQLSLSQQNTARLEVEKLEDGQRFFKSDVLAEETPIALVYNGISHAVMLASPSDLEDFALGFSLAEGIIQQPKQLYSMEIQPHAQGIEIQMQIATACFANLKALRRSMAGRTGCGLCGADSLSHALRLPSHPVAAGQPIAIESLQQALANMPALQPLQGQTGATHASAWADAKGAIQLIREDVGRHNAMDKLLGARARQMSQGQSGAGFFVTTSRASYEMVQKTAAADLPLLLAVSAPTALAVRLAESLAMTLVGFARGSQLVIYTDGQGLLQ